VQRSSSEEAPRRASGKRWSVFISHYKAEAAMEARWLQGELQERLGGKAFLDSDDLRDLRELQESVRDSEVLVVLQSASVLRRPYVLLELYTAVQAKVPIVGVALTAGEAAFDFDGAGLFLEGLESTLDAANPGSSAVLTKAGVRLADASRVLASTVPHVISIALNQGASRNVLNATLADIVEACRAAKPLAPAGARPQDSGAPGLPQSSLQKRVEKSGNGMHANGRLESRTGGAAEEEAEARREEGRRGGGERTTRTYSTSRTGRAGSCEESVPNGCPH